MKRKTGVSYAPQPKCACRRLVEKTSEADDPTEETNDLDKKNDGILNNSDELDGTYIINPDYVSPNCIQAGPNRIVPSLQLLSQFELSCEVKFHPVSMLSKASGVSAA